jgi:hypothetical protein
MTVLPTVLKLMLMTATAVGGVLVVMRFRDDPVSPFAALISAFGVVIMGLAFVLATGLGTVYLLVAGAAVCTIGFFLERIARLAGDHGEDELYG